MIDTIVIIIPISKVVITDFTRFGGENLVAQLCNFQIYGNSEKKITNNPTSSDKKRGYLPRITLSNNNVYELSKNNSELLLQALQNKLHRLSLFIEIDVLRNAYVSRIDYSKNVIIPHNCWTFINWINKADLDTRLEKTEISYSNKGYGSKQYSDDFQISN